MRFLKKISLLSITFLAMLSVSMVFAHGAHAATNGRIIDDAVFDDSSSMSAADIQNFLNQFPNSCIKNYTDSMPSSDPTQAYFSYSGTGTVAQIIRRVADVYGINPRVLITKLEQEENLVTGNQGCAAWRLASAIGFHCFDGANPRTTTFNGQTIQTCVDTDANMGPARQLTKGGWTLKWAKERANGNLAWMVPDDASIYYYGPMTQGNRKRCGSCSTVYFDGYWNGVYLESGATAALYNYTPYLGQSFASIWEGWFGSTITDRCISSLQATPQGGVTFRKLAPKLDQGVYIVYTGSATNCVEAHTWGVGVTSWQTHIASNLPSTQLSEANVQYADLNGDGVDEPILVATNNTGSGMMEFHVWNKDMKSWKDHVVSPILQGNLANGKLTFADVDGDGRDEPVLILFNNTGSGKIEFHVLNNDLRSWRWHIASQLEALDLNNGTVDFADLDGNRVDEPVLILYRNTGSGKVEFHTWNPGWASWRFHTASNLDAIDPALGFIRFADIDGNGVDEAVLVGLRNTGSGKVEFHTWNPGVQSWRYHTASNLPVQQ